MYEKLKKFIRDNGILTRKELQKNYTYKYKLFCKLSDKEKDELIPMQELGKYSDLKTIEDFQKFIDENNIKSNEEFYTNHPSVYNKCRKTLTQQERSCIKFKIIISTDNDWSSFNTLEDFQNFIDTKGIKTNKEFVEKYSGLYNKYCKIFSKEERLLKFPPQKEPFSELEDFQKYIEENKIQTYKEFRKFHKGKYSRYLEKRSNWNSDKLIFPIKSKENKYAHLKTNLDFQKYIDENNINSRKEFKENRSLENRYYRVVPKEERYLVFKNEIRKHFYDKEFSTIESFQKFIDDKNIVRPIDFRNRFPKIYDRFCRVISKEDKKKIVYKTRVRSYADINSVSKLQEFINNNDIISRKELHKIFPGLYVKFQNQLDNIIFNKSNMSRGEHFLMKLLIDNNIKFITQKTYSDLKNILPLRYDFYLPELNILLEHHGEGHFGKGRYYSQELIENDKLKYKYAVDNNITIIYYTIYKSEYLNNGYFTEVITDPEILINKILRMTT